MSNKSKDTLVLGATLFSMFFGAGNLIFPPSLGLEAGSKWLPALIGFFLTGIGLPLLGVIAAAKSDGDINKLGERVSPSFSKFLGIIVVLSIGPFLGIPRTGATTYEMAIQPFFPNFNPIIFSAIYFGIALALVINPTNIVDKIGKFLTPLLLIILALIIVLGIINPVASPVDLGMDRAFTAGFQGGYQTMDAFAALLFGGIIVIAIRLKGYEETSEQISMTLRSGIIAVIGLTFVYGGLGYLGASNSAIITEPISKVDLIRQIAENSLQSFGTIGLSLVVALACLTTSVGLISTVGQFFHNLSDGKFSYRNIVIITSIFSAILSVAGVDTMVEFSGPVLAFMYPMVIVMILLTVILSEDSNPNIFKGAISLTILVSVIEALSKFNFASFLLPLVESLPLNSLGLPWLIPAIIGGLIGSIFTKSEKLTVY